MTRIWKIQPLDAGVFSGVTPDAAEVGRAVFRREQMVGELTSEEQLQDSIWEPVQKFFDTAPDGAVSPDTLAALQDSRFRPDDELWGRAVSEMDAAGVPYPEDLKPSAMSARRDKVTEEFLARVREQDEVIGRSHGISGLVGKISGGAISSIDNVETVVTMPFSAGARAGILATALIEGGLNAGAEAATTPSRNSFLKSLGLPEESVIGNAAEGFASGALLGGGLKAILLGFSAMYGKSPAALDTTAKRALTDIANGADTAGARGAARAVLRDVEDHSAAVTNPVAGADSEHVTRFSAASEAGHASQAVALPDRPSEAIPRRHVVGGELVEIDPRRVAGGEQAVELGGEWRSDMGGVALVHEAADGTMRFADGGKRAALARRIMASDQSAEIRIPSMVLREADGYTAEFVNALAAAKNRAEVEPGAGMDRARALGNLSDEAFDMAIHQAVPEEFATMVGRMVEDRTLQASVMRELQRREPRSRPQAEAVIREAITRGPDGIEDLHVERAKVMARVADTLREDRPSAATNSEARARADLMVNRMQEAAWKPGPVMEALNDAAREYKRTGRLGDASRRAAERIRDTAGRGVDGPRTGAAGRAAGAQVESAGVPDPNAGFADPTGKAVADQIEATRGAMDQIGDGTDFEDMVPVGRAIDEDGNEAAVAMTKQDLLADMDADDAMVGFAEACLRR